MEVTLASKITFKKLCNILEEITKARDSKKVTILEKFFENCRAAGRKLKADFPDSDISLFPIMRLILPSEERERGPHNLKEKSLANLYVRVFCLGKGSKDANKLLNYKIPTSSKSTGSDFADRAYAVLRNRLVSADTEFTIERINLFLDDISRKNETVQQKDEIFHVLLKKINASELKWITRIVLKDLKLGIGTRRILQAFHSDAYTLFEVSSNLRHVCDTLHDPQTKYHCDIQVFSHFKPMLLEQCLIEDAKKLFVKDEHYFIQPKYDGERSQVHMKNGKYKYFTRQGYNITNNPGYGETSSQGFLSGAFSRLLNPDCKSIILDGELMGWHKQKKEFGSKGMNYDVKKLSENAAHQPCFVAFDIIMYNDELLDNRPYEERLTILKNAFTEEEGSLIMCKSTKISTSEELRKEFNECMKNNEEGIVAKRCDVRYIPNVRSGNGCYKIKAEYSEDLVEDVDLIILGGYYGEGKFTGLIKSFLMGVASPPKNKMDNPSEFLSIVSVSNGFTMEDLKDLRNRFEGRWIKQCPPNVIPPRLEPPTLWLRPEDSIILTVRATELSRSNDYPTEYSLRFPRVRKIRTDKPWYNVCTTTEILSLVKSTKSIQKLTKREVNDEDIKDVTDNRLRKTPRLRSIKYEARETVTNIFDNPPVPLSRLFDGKEVCVINGNDELPKERIEEILLQHRAKVVQNPMQKDCYVIVGNEKTANAQKILRTKEYDVLTLDWFKRVTKEENWSSLQDFLPWDLLCSRESTFRRLAQNFDQYYDSFITDANEESLKRSFDKASNKVASVNCDSNKAKKVDQLLFDDGISCYSIFRDIIGYFDDQIDYEKYKFRFMAGKIANDMNDSVTHIFVTGNSISSALQDLINNRSPESLKIIKSEWISECFRNRKIISDRNYLIENI